MQRWQDEKGERVVRWQGGKGGRVVKVPGFIQEWETWGPRFHLFVSDVDQQRNEGAG